MSVKYNQVRGDVVFRATFAQPAFGFLNSLPDLYSNVFNAMAQHGLQLSDMKLDQGTGTFSEFQLSMSLHNFAVNIKLRLDRFEVQSVDLTKVSPKQVLKLANEFAGVLSQVGSPKILWRVYESVLAFHGTLDGMTVKDFMGGFLRAVPESLGPPIGSGIAFYFGPTGSRTGCFLTVDASAVVPDGLFVRPDVFWDPEKIGLADLEDETEQLLNDVMKSLNLSAGLTV